MKVTNVLFSVDSAVMMWRRHTPAIARGVLTFAVFLIQDGFNLPI